ncbi:hypothetical protein F9U64_00135 [Gracilibacillus oryzae]|uniref:Uncharacterized protein n=1 Tax=Gracilibacillus oryzae TaxID=1672701 RepID=A0A7C8KUS3_9BACI|nr:hypothetical protein [Gracilibacillus oryzae]KAB8139476.1 hypothetical protein F9U64_00135 [Gracilibacillus oryzae]
MTTGSFILVYLDTNLLPKHSTIGSNEKVNRLTEWHLDQKITLRTTQGTLDDIFKNINDRNINPAEQRYKTVYSYTEPVAEIIFECNEDFDETHIDLFRIMFPDINVNSNNIFEVYNKLKSNDRNDYRIINSVIHDSHGYAFFLTDNKKDFINNGKRENINKFVHNEYRKHLTIDTLNDESMDLIKKAIIEVSNMI